MSTFYEEETALSEYLLFHYGEAEEVVPDFLQDLAPTHTDFATRTVSELLEPALIETIPYEERRALDLGCSVGRSSYELNKHCQQVTGIDASESFIKAAQEILKKGSLPYKKWEQAHHFTDLTATRPQSPSQADIQFQAGDACNLPAELGSYQVVHAANLLCRLSKPESFLDQLPSLVEKGGQLLLTTPCTWLEDYTPENLWPTTEHTDTLSYLKNHLSVSFELDHVQDIPFLYREHARKYQWVASQGSRWIRR